VQEAYEEGLRRGMEAGEAAFREEVETAAQALERAAEVMQRQREEFLTRLEAEVVELTCGILARVLSREVETDTQLCMRLARRALEALVDEEEVRLLVNPADRAALRKHRVQLLDQFPALKRLEIEEDPAVERGGCIADSPRLCADFQPRVLLDNICEDIFGRTPDDV
jgi:flagellar assembly protein FliH